MTPKGYWRRYDEETSQEVLVAPPAALDHFPPLEGMDLIRTENDGTRKALCLFTIPAYMDEDAD